MGIKDDELLKRMRRAAAQGQVLGSTRPVETERVRGPMDDGATYMKTPKPITMRRGHRSAPDRRNP